MVHVQTTVYDSQGYFSMEENRAESILQKASVRLQRDKLLDGSTFLKNHGYAEGDRDFTFISKNTIENAQVAVLWYIVKNHAQVMLSCREGLYLGVIERLSTDRGKIEFKFVPDTKYSS